MDSLITSISSLTTDTIAATLTSIAHNAFPLALGILIAVVMKVYVDPEKLKRALMRSSTVSIPASVAFGAFTPLCACGTTAVIIGMLTTTLPWGPIMAFLTSSPLMSPDGFVMLAGMISFRFAVAMTAASLVIGLGSGVIAHLLEQRTTFLDDQTRFAGKSAKTIQIDSVAPGGAASSTGLSPLSAAAVASAPACGCSAVAAEAPATAAIISNDRIYFADALGKVSAGFARIKGAEFARIFVDLGLKQILFFFAVFVAVGYLINRFIPASIVNALLGGHNLGAVPLAALVGLPLYVTTESSIPIVTSLLTSGASEGAMLAFMITGSATSAWVIAGISTFLKKRAVALYVTFILAGGILSGYVYEVFLNMAG